MNIAADDPLNTWNACRGTVRRYNGGVIGRVLPKPEALMREALSETLPVRIATGEIWAYLPVSSDEGMAAGSGTSLGQS